MKMPEVLYIDPNTGTRTAIAYNTVFYQAGDKRVTSKDAKYVRAPVWTPIGESPKEPNWYATCSIGHYEKVVPRYYDDSNDSWWIYSQHHDNRKLVPNNSFELWQPLPSLPEAE